MNNDVRILVVDDDQELADVLVEYLTRVGYQATAAYGGREGLARFEKEVFQMVITDLVMPDMDGIELMDEVKALNSRVIVMVITGHGTIEKAVAAIKKGAYDFITKPFEMQTLELTINRALEKHTLLKQLGVSRRLTLALLISLPIFMILGILLALFWK